MAVIFFRFVGLNISSNPSSTNPDLWTNSKSSFVSSTSSPLSSSAFYVTIVITIVSCVETDLKVNLSCNKEHADYFVKEKNISVVYEWVEPGVDPERGDRPPPKLAKVSFSQWICTIRKTALAIQGHFAVHCFVTTVLWSILHLSYSCEAVMNGLNVNNSEI